MTYTVPYCKMDPDIEILMMISNGRYIAISGRNGLILPNKMEWTGQWLPSLRALQFTVLILRTNASLKTVYFAYYHDWDNIVTDSWTHRFYVAKDYN